MDQKFVSKALEANLAETRYGDIKLSRENQAFVDLSKKNFGLHKRARECFVEFQHPLSNHSFVLEELRSILLADFWFYSEIPDPEQTFQAPLKALQTILANETLSIDLRELAVVSIYDFLIKLKTLEPEAYTLSRELLTHMLDQIRKSPLPFIRSSRHLKNKIKSFPFQEVEDISKILQVFCKEVFQQISDYWNHQLKIDDWLKDQNISASEKQRVRKALGPDYFAALQTQLQNATTIDDLLRQLPDNTNLAEHIAAVEDIFDSFSLKYHYIYYLLHLEGMQFLQERLIWKLNGRLRKTIQEIPEIERDAFVDFVFELANDLKNEHGSAVLDNLLTLGKEIIRLDNSDRKNWVNDFEKRLIHFGFEYPGMVYVNEDWQLDVNKNHIKNIRVWLELIEGADSIPEKLLSALIVNLKLGGIFISDTDLFQREITKILNANISPHYKKVKDLCRIFPVYFNEIGAEGEIRKVTTTMDEICKRQDKLIHFLRKQVHTESNNTLIELTRKVFDFWFDADLEKLKPILPENVYQSIDIHSPFFAPIHQMLTELSLRSGKGARQILESEHSWLYEELKATGPENQQDKERIMDMRDLYAHLKEKYSFDTVDMVSLMKKYNYLENQQIDEFKKALLAGKKKDILRMIFDFMSKLRDIIFHPEISESWENIYHKRHIAIGIPSMYGVYQEKKFEALGLSFRLEKLATRLMEEMVQEVNLAYISAKRLEEIYEILIFFKKGLELDGVFNQSFNSNLQMLKYSLSSRSFSFNQYVNIFSFIAEDVKRILIKYFLKSYEYPLEVVIPQIFDPESKLNEEGRQRLIDEKSEGFFRDIISEAFLIQPLDNFVTRILDSLKRMQASMSPVIIPAIMTYNSDLAICPLDTPNEQTDNQVFLGSKAFHLKRLYLAGFPVPPGFVVTTEVFRRRKAIQAHTEIREEIQQLFLSNLRRIEQTSGKEFGNPEKLLLLSVRSGTAISMPGAMDTFLNIGMNDDITEKFSRQSGQEWSAWDSYRRLLQSWGMVHGIHRDRFDEVMLSFKQKYDVERKIHFSPAVMREMAFAYKNVLSKHHVYLEEDITMQMIAAVNFVMDSWQSERAAVYREHLNIADEWGTAVIVQQMIFGNKQQNSGTGVVFTQNPKKDRPGVHLYGDFMLQSQGEDIVGGLVKPLPVSESQKQFDGTSGPSFQIMLPQLYKRLYNISVSLTEQHGYSPQEIEFTFESEAPEDLYILQIRDQDMIRDKKLDVFSQPISQMHLLSHGIGIGGGAMNGRLAFDAEDIAYIQKHHPKEACILARPDTVPDDIGLIFACDGLLTARGGATSHAAVTAVRLGKTCVVNCMEMIVDDERKLLYVGGHGLKPASPVAIDGHTGNLFLGNYAIERTPLGEESGF